MNMRLDLDVLYHELRQLKEQEPQYEQELNPYLMNTILPRLEREESVALGEIDFEQFDEEDLLILIDYFDWWERLQYPISSLNRRLREIPPSSIKTRAFL